MDILSLGATPLPKPSDDALIIDGKRPIPADAATVFLKKSLLSCFIVSKYYVKYILLE